MIICSAIKLKNGMIIRGHRHNDCIRTASNIPLVEREDIIDRVEGFITSENKFVKRRNAFQIAVKAGQILKALKSESEVLYSEDLY